MAQKTTDPYGPLANNYLLARKEKKLIKLIKKIIILIILVRNSLINFRKNRFQSNKKSNAHKSIQTRIYRICKKICK